MPDYDGIEERQDTHGRLPVGWLVFFIGVIAWGLWYALVHVPVGSWSQEQAYNEEVGAVPAKAVAPAPSVNPYKGVAHEVAEGHAVYAEHCASCHGEKAEGGIAPPLAGVEGYIYGGTDAELFRSVMEGRPNGMPPFGPTLGQKKVWEALAYVDSLKGGE